MAVEKPDSPKDPAPPGDQRDLEVWKHFAAMGSTDKNTMVTTVNWLLAFAATGIAYIVTDSHMLDSNFSVPSHPWGMMAISVGGLVVSAVAGYVALLYGGYTNVNWAMADHIASERDWRVLRPEGVSDLKAPKPWKAVRSLADVGWKLAESCDPLIELAPVFKVYSCLALAAALIHGVFFAVSCAAIK